MELTYGGRISAAPHKHGVRARRTKTVHVFWMVIEGSSQALPLMVFLSDGTKAMALFSGEEEAMMFCHFCEEGASTNIRQTTTGEVISLLYCPWCAAKHVALDPFPEILLGSRLLLGLLTLSRADFARRFGGLGSDPVGRVPRGTHRVRPSWRRAPPCTRMNLDFGELRHYEVRRNREIRSLTSQYSPSKYLREHEG